MTLEQAVELRLDQIRGDILSGASELTGKARTVSYLSPDTGERITEVVGRYGGLNIRELQRAGVYPKQALAAIERGRGVVFNRIVGEVVRSAEREGYKPARKRSRGRLSIPPHESKTKKCKLCAVDHSKGEHRFHGEGAFHKTHLFSFGANPMVPELFKKYLAHLGFLPAALRGDIVEQLYKKHMKTPELRRQYLAWQQRKISTGSLFNPRRKRRRRLKYSAGVHRYHLRQLKATAKRKAKKNPGKGFTFHGSFTSLLLARKRERSTPGSFIHTKGGRYYVLKPKKMRSNPRRKSRKKPNGLTKIYGRVLRIVIKGGRVVRVEAQKTQPHRCDAGCKRVNHRYYHNFSSRPVMGIYGARNKQRLYIE